MNNRLIASAKHRLLANPSVNSILNKSLQSQVSEFSASSQVKVLHLNTDGYNEPNTGSAGVEIRFVGTASSVLDYGSKVLSYEGMMWLTSWIRKTKELVLGAEVEFHADQDEFVLVVLVGAD